MLLLAVLDHLGHDGVDEGEAFGQPVQVALLVHADLGLGVLEALLQHGEQGGRRHHRPIDVRLRDVRLDAERVRRVVEAWEKQIKCLQSVHAPGEWARACFDDRHL